jgi:Vitamin K-dependent gamma-carboxylase
VKSLSNSQKYATAWLSDLNQAVSIAPLVVFRILFGLLMLGSTVRFWYFGWIEDHFLQAKFTFKYYGFEWVQLLSPFGMYALHGIMAVAAVGIMLGFWYRLSAILFFLTFTYIELIDLTYYLNHYYFVSLVALLLIFVPAHRYFSVDAYLNPSIKNHLTPRWTIFIFQLQLGIVYVYAGLAKINYDWLINALPLKIWLPANDYLPLIGWFFKLKITPYLFSWVGMIYDTTIVFWLINPKTRAWAYVSVVVFHVLTGLLFQIGVFPVVMMGATWIFFSPEFHQKVIDFLRKMLRIWSVATSRIPSGLRGGNWVISDVKFQISDSEILETQNPKLEISNSKLSFVLLSAFFIFQLLFPWRYIFYPNNHYWSEEGYRFGWRVMLMEKAGTATFFVKDAQTGREGLVDNSEFLCAHQEKQMSMQPDMLLQFFKKILSKTRHGKPLSTGGGFCHFEW